MDMERATIRDSDVMDALLSEIMDSSQKTRMSSAASIPAVLTANGKLSLPAGLHAAPAGTKKEKC